MTHLPAMPDDDRPDAQALDGLDRLTIVEARLDLVDDRLAEVARPWPAMSDAEARWLRHRANVVAALAAFVAVVAALTAIGYWAIEAGKAALG